MSGGRSGYVLQGPVDGFPFDSRQLMKKGKMGRYDLSARREIALAEPIEPFEGRSVKAEGHQEGSFGLGHFASLSIREPNG